MHLQSVYGGCARRYWGEATPRLTITSPLSPALAQLSAQLSAQPPAQPSNPPPIVALTSFFRWRRDSDFRSFCLVVESLRL